MNARTMLCVWQLFIAGYAANALGDAPPAKKVAPTKAAKPPTAPAAGYTVGVVPQMDPERLKATWVPFLEKVSAESGLVLEFATTPSIAEFHSQVIAHGYDFVYVNPIQYVRVSDHYAAIARQAKKKLSGILVKRKSDQSIRTVANLKGKKVVFPAGAFAATMINKLVIAQAKIKLDKQIKITEVPTHEAGYELVAAGKADAAGGANATFNAMPEATRAKLVIFNTSEEYSPHPLCARKTLAPAVVKKLQDALIKVGSDPANQALMKSMLLGPLEAVTDADYQDLREFSELATMLNIHE